jgi:hypothetical protein
MNLRRLLDWFLEDLTEQKSQPAHGRFYLADSTDIVTLMMRKSAYWALILTGLVMFAIQSVSAEDTKRLALVIGNSAYTHSPALRNPGNDAGDFASKLRKLGFDVILLKDATLQQMDEAIIEFGRKLEKQSGIGLFFYAGHGIQSEGRNYLIPVGAKLERESSLKYESVDMNRVLDEMGYAKNGLNIVILDACRNNPLARSFRSASRGLAKPENTPTGTLLAYSTAPGQVAADGDGRNSPYTTSLISALSEENLPLELVFKNVIKDVKSRTRGQQVPWISSSVDGDFFFNPSDDEAVESASATPASAQEVALASNDDSALAENLWRFELLYWEGVIKNPSESKFNAYLRDYPDGHFVPIARSELKALKENKAKVQARSSETSAGKNTVETAARSRSSGGKSRPNEQEMQMYSDYAVLVSDLIDRGEYDKANSYFVKMAMIDPEGEELNALRARFEKAVKLSDEDQQIYDEYLEVVQDILAYDKLTEKQALKVKNYLAKMEKINPFGTELGQLRMGLTEKSL